MKHFKAIFFSGALVFFAAVALVFLGVNTSVAHADTDPCGVTADQVAQITAIQNDPTLSSSQEIQKELALRKQLVAETISCAQADVQTYQTALQATPINSSTSQALQAQFLGKLSEATDFYSGELIKSNQNGIAETKIVAKEVLAWRQNTLDPLTDQINNFLLWTQNQPLFDTAQTRMDQTGRAVAFLEGISPNTDLQNAFASTTGAFSTALSQNTQAGFALTQGSSADQSLVFIKQSLDSLSSTYHGFATVSTLIKSILPK